MAIVSINSIHFKCICTCVALQSSLLYLWCWWKALHRLVAFPENTLTSSYVLLLCTETYQINIQIITSDSYKSMLFKVITSDSYKSMLFKVITITVHRIHVYACISQNIYPWTWYHTDNSSYTRVTHSGKNIIRKESWFFNLQVNHD